METHNQTWIVMSRAVTYLKNSCSFNISLLYQDTRHETVDSLFLSPVLSFSCSLCRLFILFYFNFFSFFVSRFFHPFYFSFKFAKESFEFSNSDLPTEGSHWGFASSLSLPRFFLSLSFFLPLLHLKFPLFKLLMTKLQFQYRGKERNKKNNNKRSLYHCHPRTTCDES